MYRERESEKKVTVNLYGNNRLKKKEKYEDEKKVMIRIKKNGDSGFYLVRTIKSLE